MAVATSSQEQGGTGPGASDQEEEALLRAHEAELQEQFHALAQRQVALKFKRLESTLRQQIEQELATQRSHLDADLALKLEDLERRRREETERAESVVWDLSSKIEQLCNLYDEALGRAKGLEEAFERSAMSLRQEAQGREETMAAAAEQALRERVQAEAEKQGWQKNPRAHHPSAVQTAPQHPQPHSRPG